MKRFLSILLVLTILTIPAVALADYDYDSIKTPNMIVVDGDDPSVVFFERNADQKVYPASTTKIMTTLVTLDNGNLDDSFTVGEEVLGLVGGEMRAHAARPSALDFLTASPKRWKISMEAVLCLACHSGCHCTPNRKG